MLLQNAIKCPRFARAILRCINTTIPIISYFENAASKYSTVRHRTSVDERSTPEFDEPLIQLSAYRDLTGINTAKCTCPEYISINWVSDGRHHLQFWPLFSLTQAWKRTQKSPGRAAVQKYRSKYMVSGSKFHFFWVLSQADHTPCLRSSNYNRAILWFACRAPSHSHLTLPSPPP